MLAGRQPHRPWRFGCLEKEKEEARHFTSRHGVSQKFPVLVLIFLKSGQARNVRPSCPRQLRGVLIPLKSGQARNHVHHAGRFHQGVLIPLKSGQARNQCGRTRGDDLYSLNPFEIRAGQKPPPASCLTACCCLNPFEIRAGQKQTGAIKTL